LNKILEMLSESQVKISFGPERAAGRGVGFCPAFVGGQINVTCLLAGPDVVPHQEQQDCEDGKQQYESDANHTKHGCSPLLACQPIILVPRRGGNSAVLQPHQMAGRGSYRILARNFRGQFWLSG
jgi:hypothetical protein